LLVILLWACAFGTPVARNTPASTGQRAEMASIKAGGFDITPTTDCMVVNATTRGDSGAGTRAWEGRSRPATASQPLLLDMRLPRHHERGLRLSELGLEVGIRSSEITVWHFDVFPTPHQNRFFTACLTQSEDATGADTGSSSRAWSASHKCDQQATLVTSTRDDASSGGAVHRVKFELTDLPPGAHEVIVSVLDGSRKRLAVSAAVHVWVLPPGPEGAAARDAMALLGAEATRRDTSLQQEQRRLRRERTETASRYPPLHPQLRAMRPAQMADPELWRAVQSGDPRQLHALMRAVEPSVTAGKHMRGEPASRSDGIHGGVFMFQLFSDEFCRLMVEEVKHAVAWQMGAGSNDTFTRPNTMNNYGFVVDELGLDLMPLVTAVLTPLAALYFPDWGGATIDSTHAFTISYSMAGDRDLSRHMDLSEVTVNANLGGLFTGGEVYFEGQRDSILHDNEHTKVAHSRGMAVMHAGQHFHGAHPLSSGERHNLVIWMRSAAFSSSPAHRFLRQCPAPAGAPGGQRGAGTRWPPPSRAEGHLELRR